MPDQDDPDVIEQAPRQVSIPRVPWMPAGERPATVAAVVAALVLLAVAGTFAALRLTSSGPAGPALARLVTEVTTVPVGPSAPASPDDGLVTFERVSGSGPYGGWGGIRRDLTP